MSNPQFKKLEKSIPIHDSVPVKVTAMNHIVEVVYVSNESNTLEDYRKVDKENYIIVDRETGEVIEEKEYNISENRAQNTSGLKRTMKNIRDLINNNFTGANNELFITLTYRLNEDGTPMNDVKKASKDFDNFIKCFRRRYTDLEYVAVLEPQANTAWHWHLLAKFTDWHKQSHIRIDNNTIIEPLWGHGFTKTKRINNVDNIGAYLSAYLASVEINDENKDEVFDAVYKSGQDIVIEEKEVTGAYGKKVSKKFVKGARMHLYKSGTNIYRYSRGIEKPISQIMTYSEAKEIVGSVKPNYSRTISIVGDKNGIEKTLNIVTYEHYNLKRKSTSEQS